LKPSVHTVQCRPVKGKVKRNRLLRICPKRFAR
jgi:hypothetical protein